MLKTLLKMLKYYTAGLKPFLIAILDVSGTLLVGTDPIRNEHS